MATPVEEWVEEQAKIARPRKIYWCDGSEGEAYRLLEIGMNEKWTHGHPLYHRLSHKKWPESEDMDDP